MTSHKKIESEPVDGVFRENIPAIQDALLAWFAGHQRDFPWRKNYVPYHIWISEIMGQQTQMDRVVDYFLRWIDRFPDIEAVAAAQELLILKAWEGLGYYSRAKNIVLAAQAIMKTHDGQLPADYAKLLALPGIGPYTAAAIMSIAFNEDFPLLDANVERLFTRLLDIAQPVKNGRSQSLLRDMAQRLLPGGRARMFNQALMEFGALICKPRNPECSSCFLASYCLALERETVEARPVRLKKGKTIDIVMACGIIEHQGLYYIQQRRPDGVWGSLWEFPGGRLKQGETPQQAARREIEKKTAFLVGDLQPFFVVIHHYTKYRVTLHSFTCSLVAGEGAPVLNAALQYRWSTSTGLVDYPFPSGHKQLVDHLLKQQHFVDDLPDL